MVVLLNGDPPPAPCLSIIHDLVIDHLPNTLLKTNINIYNLLIKIEIPLSQEFSITLIPSGDQETRIQNTNRRKHIN